MILLLACIHTPPYEPLSGKAYVQSGYLADMTPDGDYCELDLESLLYLQENGEKAPIWVSRRYDP